MDWSRIDREVTHLATLSPESAFDYLKSLEETEPEVAELVAGFAGRERRTASFLRTSAPETVKIVETLPVGTRLGQWALDELLGSGGMGAVYKAHRADELYEQTVAVKIVEIVSASQRARFDQERQRLARLEHPGVVRIIDGGVSDDDLAYLVMELVDGAPLDDWLADQGADVEATLRLFLDVADALSHAHSRLILHRDVKPSNILVSAEGQAKLIDFGIGAELESAEAAPLAMTLPYAAPEQLNRKAADVGSDVFALGATLHTALTGVPPAREADGGVSVKAAALKGKELRAILDKALARDPEDRYATVDAFAEDVRHHLDKEPVEAFSATRRYRAAKFLSRYPASSALAAGLLVVLVAGLGASLYSADRAQKALVRAEHALERERVAKASEAAFTDTLLRLFNRKTGEGAMTEILMEHADTAYELRGKDPERAAMAAYAVGRSLIFQGNFREAREVLEPWIAEGYGPEQILWLGRLDLGYAYSRMGESEESLKLMREAKAYFAGMSDEPSYELVVSQQHIANATRQQEDYQELADYAERALAADAQGNERAHYYNSLETAYMRLGDFDKGAKYAREGLDFHIANPLLNAHRLGYIRVNVATFDIYHTGQYAEARELLTANIEDPEIPTNLVATSTMLMANLEIEEGHFEAAKEWSEAALVLFREDEDMNLGVRSDLVENAILRGDLDEAARRLSAIDAEYDGDPPWDPRLVIARAHYRFAAGRPDEALAYLAENGVTPAMARESAVGTHRMNRLRKLGLDVDSLDEPEDGEGKN